MEKFSTSLIITVKNEAQTIQELLESIVAQSMLPEEVIIIDGGSEDETYAIANRFAQSAPELTWRISQHICNRSKGRNIAISMAKNEWIAITDAGCVLDEHWLEELVKTQQRSNAPVIAGYYQGKASTPFEKAVVPYALVMPNRVDENSFLPSSRSMLLHTEVWKKIGGFPEQLEVGEDFLFAKQIRRAGFDMAFAPQAVVGWRPRSDLASFFKMIKSMAAGDAFSGEIRQKVRLVFARYAVVSVLVLLAFSTGSIFLAVLLLSAGVLYALWAIAKNLRFAKDGWKWLPTLQFVSDAGVILGTLEGVTHRRLISED